MTTPFERQSDRSRLSWRTATAAVVVALVLLAALAVIWATRGRDVGPPASASSSASSGPATSSPTSTAEPVVDQTVPQAPPPGVTWSLFQGVALPSSATAGPTRVDGPVHAGFQRSPAGALLAATQIGARHLISPANEWRRVVDEQVVANGGREVFVRERAKVTTTNVAPGTYGQTAGFRFVTYTPDTAVIQFVSRFSSGTLQMTTSTVRWVDGDWKLELQPDGSESPTAQRVDSLVGFVPWGAV